ncbi:MAG: hypothetical protein HC854_07760 [Flavobacterium sp.]|nr:hypothetical protein [Flavobacterium sp.]
MRDYFESIDEIEIVYKAALSLNQNDKIFSHQKRIGKKNVKKVQKTNRL